MDRRRCETTGKVRWTSARLAKRATAGVANRLRVYRCEDCNGWHVTDHEAEGQARGR
jgi:hypothetical protein